MTRVLLFSALASLLVAYAFWVYLRVDLRVPAARTLAVVRAVTLVLALLLLFDPRLPTDAVGGGAGERWVLLDASLSMSATREDGTSPWSDALARADALTSEGWTVVRFGDERVGTATDRDGEPDQLASRLAPAVTTAAESGVRAVRVLTDARFEDAVTLRSTLTELPLDVTFESFGHGVVNAGIARLHVPDLLLPTAESVAELEVFGDHPADSIAVDVFEEGSLVATVNVALPGPGLRSTATVPLPSPSASGRVRYVARLAAGGDGFPDDDVAVDYANVGFEEGGLVLVSARPDWEPRYLLPVLEDVTGLPTTGYLAAGDNRFVRLGRAAERGPPPDSATVRRSAAEASVLVVHGLGERSPAWLRELTSAPGRRLVFPTDAFGADVAGLDVEDPSSGEWYASPEVPASPIAGALSGVDLQGLPPLNDLMAPIRDEVGAPIRLRLRGAGPARSAIALDERPSGRVAVALAGGFWRWAMRDSGREPYRRLWSGVAGWLLRGGSGPVVEARPTSGVVARGDPVVWRMRGDTSDVRVRVTSADSAVVDTVATGRETVTTPPLPPGSYRYTVQSAGADTIGAGRFDVASATLEMLPPGAVPDIGGARTGAASATAGRPVRTSPWPYALILILLCVEWVARRRSGLR